MNHRAICPECPWTGDAETLSGAAREVDEHREETGHDAKVDRDVATDGGQPDGELDRPAFVDPNADYVLCHFCGQEWRPREVDGFDLSQGDEYYPNMVPVCPEHMGCR